ncbi:uncharacterized protein TNCT_303831 [Trichonephila clavata]|uniref:Uncharacterized protein n=1 Tax=Trichonephila clavata TaxID=2740835 RepID=A0A8X6J7T5_TRICU|nr:uncharacterized protein TNCT_303831 [Trichonephila clavata]
MCVDSLDSEYPDPTTEEDVPIELRHLEGYETCKKCGTPTDFGYTNCEQKVCASCLPADPDTGKKYGPLNNDYVVKKKKSSLKSSNSTSKETNNSEKRFDVSTIRPIPQRNNTEVKPEEEDLRRPSLFLLFYARTLQTSYRSKYQKSLDHKFRTKIATLPEIRKPPNGIIESVLRNAITKKGIVEVNSSDTDQIVAVASTSFDVHDHISVLPEDLQESQDPKELQSNQEEFSMSNINTGNTSDDLKMNKK